MVMQNTPARAFPDRPGHNFVSLLHTTYSVLHPLHVHAIRGICLYFSSIIFLRKVVCFVTIR